ncbi:LOW QUALITY PROTEIN: conglutin beta 1-like [Stylophora pistillata]|uniref:LOW QUALITY PROTEIN: conglutin beta 1-like n=1 Tax=Stylophora pistillata TaxID=50429 RepID=UPI000C0471DE|nr:LOW QUALITY PROTEIN: conglutin beta 1-like [Stylophora pistillata]
MSSDEDNEMSEENQNDVDAELLQRAGNLQLDTDVESVGSSVLNDIADPNSETRKQENENEEEESKRIELEQQEREKKRLKELKRREKEEEQRRMEEEESNRREERQKERRKRKREESEEKEREHSRRRMEDRNEDKQKKTCNKNSIKSTISCIECYTKIFQHVVTTLQQLHVRPVVLLCGDQQQQKQITAFDGNTKSTEGILQRRSLFRNSVVVLRYFKPSLNTIRQFEQGRVLLQKEPRDIDILNVLKEYPEALILTLTRAATARVNRVAVNNLFEQGDFLGHIRYNDHDEFIPLFKNMRVVITQNRNKELTVVNGQTGIVITMHNATVFLKLPNDSIVAIYAVIQKVENEMRTTYPIVPAYASTICKVQGQNLGKVIVWLDSAFVPEGAAYVAISRLRKLDDLPFLT